MPAIQIARLKVHISNITAQVDQPERFMHDLRELFDFYADRVYRAGQTVPPPSRIPAYHTPPLIMHQLKAKLSQLCHSQPLAVLMLADALWLDSMLEPRLLAVFILGQLPASQLDLVLKRLTAWSVLTEDRLLLSALLSDGTMTMRKTTPKVWLESINQWIQSTTERQQSIALQALLPLINDSEVQVLPAVFSFLQALLHSPPPNLQNDLTDVLEACAHRSPVETGFYLRQILTTAPSLELTRLVRRIFPLLPPDSQEKLRNFITPR